MSALMLAPTSEHDLLEEELRDFSYIVSHDLASEFRHVAVFSKQLLAEPEIRANPAWSAHADIISRSADRCRHMLDQLRLYSRAQQAVMALQRRSPQRIVELALLQLSAPIRITHANVKFDVCGEVLGDDQWLTVAFHHVIENALQFPKPGCSPRVTITGGPEGEQWVLRVSDEGVGLEPRYWEKAFRMFWQLDPDVGVGGVGSGLSICRRIVRRHRGDVRFIRHDGGACVEIAIPA